MARTDVKIRLQPEPEAARVFAERDCRQSRNAQPRVTICWMR